MSELIAFTVAGLTFLASGFKIIGSALVGDINLGFGSKDDKTKTIEVDQKRFKDIKNKTKGNSNSWDKNKMYDDDVISVNKDNRTVTKNLRYSIKNTEWLLLIGGILGIFILSYMYMTDGEFRQALKGGAVSVGKKVKDVVFSKKYSNVKIIILGLIIAFLLIYIYSYLFKGVDSILLVKDCNAKTETKNVNGSKIRLPKEGLQWSYNMWVYITNWEYKYDERKDFFVKDGHIKMSLGEKNPTLHINVTTDSGNEDINVEKICKENNLCTDGLNIEKWNMITLTVNNKNVRFYHNGKLIIGKKLKGLPVLGDSDIKIGNESFDGKIKNARYYKRVLSDSEITRMSKKNPESLFRF